MKFTDLFKQVGRDRGIEASAEDLEYANSVVPELAAWDIPKELVPKANERAHKEIGDPADSLPSLNFPVSVTGHSQVSPTPGN